MWHVLVSTATLRNQQLHSHPQSRSRMPCCWALAQSGKKHNLFQKDALPFHFPCCWRGTQSFFPRHESICLCQFFPYPESSLFTLLCAVNSGPRLSPQFSHPWKSTVNYNYFSEYTQNWVLPLPRAPKLSRFSTECSSLPFGTQCMITVNLMLFQTSMRHRASSKKKKKGPDSTPSALSKTNYEKSQYHRGDPSVSSSNWCLLQYLCQCLQPP